MNHRTRAALTLALYITLVVPLIAGADEDDAPPKKSASAAQTDSGASSAAPSRAPSGAPSLSVRQRRAVGLEVAHPVPAVAPERLEALGTVLDATALLADEQEAVVGAATAQAAAAELARLDELRKAGAGASLKMIEAARTEAAKAGAESRLAAARFAQHWGPLAGQSSRARDALLGELQSGRTALVRADLPGRHTVGALPTRALLELDGAELPGRVLGVLAQASDLQSAGLLVEVRNPPAGLAPGARMPLSLLGAERRGLSLPADALLFGEDGAYVYKQLAAKAPGDPAQYLAVKVTPLLPYAGGWLVTGVDDDDDIVVHGAGVLWSLQGVGGHPAADDDED